MAWCSYPRRWTAQEDAITRDLLVAQIPPGGEGASNHRRVPVPGAGLAPRRKRELAQLNSFDLVVLLLLSNTVQNAIIGPDNSLLGGLLGAAVLLAANYTTVGLGFEYPALARALEGTRPRWLQDGRMLDDNLRRYLITREELMAAIRR